MRFWMMMEVRMADQPADFEAKRWEQGMPPGAYEPVTALRRALAAIEEGKIKPIHVMVVFTEGDRSGYFQAGELCQFAQIGLLDVAAHMLKDNV